MNLKFTVSFQELIRSSAVLEDQQLKITSTLAFSHVLRAACIDRKTRYAHYTDEIFDATCEHHQASSYVAWLASMLRSDPSSRRVYIAALGNTGAASALQHLRSIAEDISVSSYTRATAVISMKYQALRFPEQTSAILLSLYHDMGQPVAVRATAVAMLFYTKPEIVLLQRIAVSTWYEPSMEVAAFVRSSLISLAKLEDPVFTEL
jgi:HEAT repeat protein